MAEQAGLGGAAPVVDPTTVAMCDAAHEGNVALLRQLMATGASVNAQNAEHLTPLHCAISGEQVNCVGELLKHPQIDVHASGGRQRLTNEYIGTPLHYTVWICTKARLKIAALLLDHGADILAKSDGRTAFEDACRHAGNTEMVRLLFEKRKDVLLRDNQWVTSPRVKRMLSGPSHELPHCHAADFKQRNEETLDFLFAIDEQYNVTYSSEQFEQLVFTATHNLMLFKKLFEKCQLQLMGDDAGESLLFTERYISADVLQFVFERGYKPYRVDVETGKLTMLLLEFFSATKFVESGVAKVCIEHTPSDIVQQFNEQCSKTAIQKTSHPLYPALSSSHQFSTALLLLDTGFDPRNLHWSGDSMSESKHFWAFRECVADAFGFGRCSINAICCTIVTPAVPVHGVSEFGKLLGALMQRGVSITATGADEMCPLTLLAVKCYQEETLNPHQSLYASEEIHFMKLLNEQKLNAVFLDLLNSNVDFSYRRRLTPRPKSAMLPYGGYVRIGGVLVADMYDVDPKPFLCPDVAVAAALVGNTCILSHLILKLELNPCHLLTDLLSVAESKFHSSHYISGAFSNQMILITTIGTSTLKLLKYGVKNAPMRWLCTELHAKLASAYKHQASEFTQTGRQNVPQRAAQDKLWKDVFEEVEKIDRLKHLCRMKIFEQLKQSEVVGSTTEKVKSIPNIPPSVEEYLKFGDEVEHPELDSRKEENPE